MAQKKSNSKNLNGEKNEKPQNAYFLSLELENIRCFREKQKIDFSDGNKKPKSWTIILGDNGTGKTTILQAVVYYFLRFRVDNIVEEAKRENKLNKSLLEKIQHDINESNLPKGILIDEVKKIINKVDFTNEKLAIASTLSEKSIPNLLKSYFLREKLDGFATVTSTPTNSNCFAYGASRKSGKTSLSDNNLEYTYITLFDETALLINPEEWLLQADYALRRESEFKKNRLKELNLVKDILVKVLPDVDKIRFSEKSEENKRISNPTIEFHTHYGWVEAKDLSLGYRTSMAWIVDFASRMFDLYPKSENPLAEPAVVLIDEIDLHLHPKWQRELLDYLSNLFPNTQFIVTTHSPLIVQSAVARDANIVVCRREDDHVVIDQSVEAVRNWRADQILTSDLFGLETARPKEIEPFLEEREKILSKAKLTKKDEKRLSELENEIGFMPVSENPEDDKAMDIIRRAAERLESQK